MAGTVDVSGGGDGCVADGSSVGVVGSGDVGLGELESVVGDAGFPADGVATGSEV